MLKKAYKYITRKAYNLFGREKVFPLKAISSLDSEIIAEYNATRNISNRKYICYAPFKNIYFNIQGDAAPCWLTFKDPDSYPDKSIHDIWFGEKFTELREKISNFDLSGKCSVCNHYIQGRNYVTPLAKAYDNDYPEKMYPVMMELELANTCNLECVMCNGRLSSSIRKNREKKSPWPIPYDENFVRQLEEFIPHLEEARFNGGEPFLNEVCYRIWENILKVKPGMKVVIATNGTVLNDKVKEILGRGRFDINLSCDSLNKNTYERIRVNAVFEKTMENIDWFHDYCKRKGTTLCILTNPLRSNWQEMPDFISFCNERNLPIWFNTIHRPYDQAIWTLDSGSLKNIFDTLSRYEFATNPLKPQTFHNAKVFRNLVHNQINTWMNEALDRENQNITLKENREEVVVSSDDPKKYFYDNFRDYFNETGKLSDLNDKSKDELLYKFELVREIVVKEIPEEVFFAKLIQIPVEKIILDLQREPIDLLVGRAKKL